MLRKILKYVGILIGLLIVAIVAILLLVDFDAVINDQLEAERPKLEARLGRKVRFGPVKATFFPLGAVLGDVQIAGRTPEEAPLLTLKAARFRVDLWRAIASAGRDTRLDELEVDGLVVHLIREADGHLSYEDVLQRLGEGPPPEQAPEPMTAEQKQALKNLVLDRVALVNAEIHLEDRATGGAPAVTYIKDLSIELNDVALVSPFEIHLKAAVIADQPNFDLTLRLGPVPIGEPGVVPLHRVRLKATDIDLAALTPYLGGEAPVAIGAARLSADLDLLDPLAQQGDTKLSGSLTVKRLQLGEPLGQPFTLAIAPRLAFNPGAGVLDLTGLAVALDDMQVTADGRIVGIGAGPPRFEGVKLRSEKLDFDRLLALLPPLRAALPPGAKLAGPFGFDVLASGTAEAQTFEATVDFDQALIHVPGALAKPRGAALHVKTKADVAPDELRLHRFALGLGPMALDLTGTVRRFAQPILNLKGDTGRFDINGLVRLIPAVQAAVPPDVKIAGQARIDVQLAGTADQLKGGVTVGVYGADLAVPGATLQGTGEIVARVDGNPAAALAVNVDSDLAGLAIQAGDAFRKPAGTPLALHAAIQQAPKRTQIQSFSLHLGPLQATGSATLGESLAADVAIARFSVAELAGLLPALKETPIAQAALGLKVKAAGNPAVPSTMEARIDDLDFALGKSKLTGFAEVKNLDAPRVRFDLRSPWLDLDALLPAGGEEEPPPAAGPPQIPDIVRRIDGEGSLQVAQGIFGGLPFTRFIGQLSLKNGKLAFTKLDFDAYEGHFTGAGTHADLAQPKPAFGLKFALQGINAARLLAEQAGVKKSLTGKLSTTLELAGKGLTWEELAPTLSGALGLEVLNGAIRNLNTETAILGGVAALLPLIQSGKLQEGQSFKRLAASFELSAGRLNLKQPLKLEGERGSLAVTGGIGLDKTLALTGTVELPAKLIELVSAGRIKVKKPLPVALKIGGTLDDPKISGVEVRALATELARAAGLKGLDEARAEVEKRLDEAKAVVEEKVDAAKAEAKARVDAARQEAEAKAEAAKAEAKRRADEARKKAADEAKKRGRGVVDKLF